MARPQDLRGVAAGILGRAPALLALAAGLLAGALAGGAAAALAAWVLALHPPAIFLARIPEATGFSALLAATAALAAAAARRSGRGARSWTAAGAVAGLAALSNPLA